MRPLPRALLLLPLFTAASLLAQSATRPAATRPATTRPATRVAVKPPPPELLAEWTDLESRRVAAVALARKVDKGSVSQARENFTDLAARTAAFDAKLAPFADASPLRPGGPTPREKDGIARAVHRLKTSRQINAYNASRQSEMTPDEYGVFVELNAYRHAVGLLPVEYDLRLRDAARGHADWMNEHNQLEHDSDKPGYKTPDQRLSKEGYTWRAVAENIAEGHPDAKAVFRGWFESPGHHHNLVGDFTHMGVGKHGRYWAQNFASGEPAKFNSLK